MFSMIVSVFRQQTLQNFYVGVVVLSRLGQFPVGVSVFLCLSVPHQNLPPTPRNHRHEKRHGFHYTRIPFHRFSSIAPYLSAEIGSRLDIVERNFKLLWEFVLLISQLEGHVSIDLIMKIPNETESKDVHVSSPIPSSVFYLHTTRFSRQIEYFKRRR